LLYGECPGQFKLLMGIIFLRRSAGPPPDPEPELSAFGEFVAAMTPGTYAEYTPATPFTSSMSAWGGGGVGSYCTRGCYDPLNAVFNFTGGPHDSAFEMRHLRFTEGTDVCAIANDADATSQPYLRGSTTIHGYHHTCLDPATGDYYHNRTNTSRIYRLPGSQYPTATSGWTEITTGFGQTVNAAQAIEWFPERGTLIHVDSFTGVWEYDPVGDDWTELASAASVPNMSYHNWTMYHPTEQAVYFGGGDGGGSASVVMYRLAANGTVTSRANTPVPCNTQSGGMIVPDHSGDATLICYESSFASGREFRYTQSTNGWSASLGTHGLTGEWLAAHCPQHACTLILDNANQSGVQTIVHRH
jgi:hypothetical protein